LIGRRVCARSRRPPLRVQETYAPAHTDTWSWSGSPVAPRSRGGQTKVGARGRGVTSPFYDPRTLIPFQACGSTHPQRT
jgi:hypothetical protein